MTLSFRILDDPKCPDRQATCGLAAESVRPGKASHSRLRSLVFVTFSIPRERQRKEAFSTPACIGLSARQTHAGCLPPGMNDVDFSEQVGYGTPMGHVLSKAVLNLDHPIERGGQKDGDRSSMYVHQNNPVHSRSEGQQASRQEGPTNRLTFRSPGQLNPAEH